MAITAAMVKLKELREVSGCWYDGLQESSSSYRMKVIWTKQWSSWERKRTCYCSEKAGRIAAEGIVMLNVSEDGKKAVAVEVNAETDFVAKNEKFRGYVAQVAEQAMDTTAADVEGFWQSLEIRYQRDRWRRAGSSDRYHRREHEHPSFPAGKKRRTVSLLLILIWAVKSVFWLTLRQVRCCKR